jgi:hypothetical protein
VEHPNWLDSLIKWIKKSLGFKSSDRPTVEILDEYHADGISVFQIKDGSIPGCCDLWRIDRHHERIRFFICCINLRSLRADLALMGGSSTIAKSGGGGLVGNLNQQMQQQSAIAASHYWVSGWSKTVSSVDSKGRPYQTQRTSGVQLVAVDLQGAADQFAGDKYIKRFAWKIIKQLAANDFRELEHHRTWQGAVKAIDWVQWLTGLAQSKGGIDPNHNLQPLKPDCRKIGDRHRMGS